MKQSVTFNECFNLLSDKHKARIIILTLVFGLSGLADVLFIAISALALSQLSGVTVDFDFGGYQGAFDQPDILSLFIVVGAIKFTLQTTVVWASVRLATDITSGLRLRLFSRIMLQQYPGEKAISDSRLIYGFESLASQVGQNFALPFMRILYDLCVVFLMVMASAFIDWRLPVFLGSLVCLLSALAYLSIFRPSYRNGLQTVQKGSASLHYFKKSVEATMEVSAFSITDRVISGMRQCLFQWKKPFSKVLFFAALPRMSIELFTFLSLTLVLILGYQVGETLNHPAVIIGAVLALLRVGPSLGAILTNGNQMKVAFASCREFSECLETMGEGSSPLPEEPGIGKQSDLGLRIKVDQGSVERGSFKSKSFSFDVGLGDLLLITGPSGSGKTSLLLGLPSFLNIKIHNLRILHFGESALGSLRQFTIGLASQRPLILPDSLGFNLYFRDEISLTEKNEAFAVLERLGLVDELDLTVDTFLDLQIGETGIQLSGGQVQRISVARVGLIASIIKLFDEPTSALDRKSAAKVAQYIESLAIENICLVVSHDMESFQNYKTKVEL